MYMRETRWIGDDGLGDKGRLGTHVRLHAAAPASLEHFRDHRAFALNIARPQTLHVGYEPWIFNHVRHQFGWVPSNRIELEPRFRDEILKDIVCGEPYAVTVFLQFVPKRDEGLNISATAYDLDDNVEFNVPISPFQIVRCR
jgi:hypothetical protein